MEKFSVCPYPVYENEMIIPVLFKFILRGYGERVSHVRAKVGTHEIS